MITLFSSIALSGIFYAVLRKKRLHLKKQKEQKKAPSHSAILSPAEKAACQQQYIALSALCLSVLGKITLPVFAMSAIPLLAYNYFGLIKKIRDAYRNNEKIIVIAYDIISVALAIFISSQLVVAFLFSILYSAHRLIALTERQTQVDFSRIFDKISTTAWVMIDDVETEVPLSSLQTHDVIVVHAGDIIPVDGHVVAGEGVLDQHLLTGEFQPAEKKTGDAVFTSTLLISGMLHIRIEQQGSETVTGQIAKTLEHASLFNQQLQSRGDEIVEKGASRTLLFCGVMSPFIGLNQVFALSFSGFGYQMRAAAPLMVFNYLRIASKQGVLIKDGRALDKLHKVDTIVFDKTGTLTEEIPQVVKIITCGRITEQRLLQYAASAEQRQKHPVGLAICHHARERNVQLLKLQESSYVIGHGLRAELFDQERTLPDQTVLIGSQRFIEAANIDMPKKIKDAQVLSGERGHSMVYIATGSGMLLGAIQLGPILRPKVKETVAALHKSGIDTYIISGDQEKPTRDLASILGIKHYFSETLPKEKASIVQRLQSEGRTVCFMGDGINDSVALQTANISVSLQNAATIAQDVADIVLIKPDLQYLPYLLSMSEALHRRMNRSEWMNNLSGIACISGVLIFGMGVSGAILIYSGGFAANIINAMLPLLPETSPKSIQ